jgi:hypothetical protein
MMTRAFLDALFGDVTGQVECRSWAPADRRFTTPGAWSPLGPFITREVNARKTVGVGIATRRDATDGTSANLDTLPALFVDIDRPPADVRTLFDTWPFRWSLLVESGYGVHAYLKLREPLDLQAGENLARAASALRRLSAYCGGDPQCCDVARVLRLPGTLNHKYRTPRPVRLVEHTPAVVNLEELEHFLPREVVRGRQVAIEAAIPVGCRNELLYRTARGLRARRLPWPMVVSTIRILNTIHCAEPLHEAELIALLHHALVQPDRPDFLAHPMVIVHGPERRR